MIIHALMMRVKTKIKSFTAHAIPCELMFASTLSGRIRSCFIRAHRLSIFLKHGRFWWCVASCSASSQPCMAISVSAANFSWSATAPVPPKPASAPRDVESGESSGLSGASLTPTAISAILRVSMSSSFDLFLPCAALAPPPPRAMYSF
uniref:(northern house mosquito) hypothetical protein n=1 Tax=Culex pipiens TaxID=7175 RepID=A0A8D8NHU4_CULPI